MATINLGELRGNQTVVEFDITSESNGATLQALSSMIFSINEIIDPKQDIEVRATAIEMNAFRFAVKRTGIRSSAFPAREAEDVFWIMIATLIYENLIRHEPGAKITVKGDEVILQEDGDTIIVPRSVYDRMPAIRASPDVQRNLRQAFQALVDSPTLIFRLMPQPEARPLVEIRARKFPLVATAPPAI